MKSIWYSLLWKECREHRWKLATLAAIFALVPVVASLRRPEAIFGSTSLLMFIAIPLASVFVATHLAAGEQTRGTSGFLLALPVARWRPAVAKLLWGAITVVAPVVVAIAVIGAWSWRLNPGVAADAIQMDQHTFQTSWLIDDWYLARSVGGSLGAISILVWMVAAGVNRSDEVRAAVVGLLISLAFWLLLLMFPLSGFAVTGEYWWHLLTAAGAGGPSLGQPGDVARAMARTQGPLAALWPFAAVAALSHFGLACWFILRYGRAVRGRAEAVDSQTAPAERTWLALPRRGPVTAIFWQQFRVSAPLNVAVAFAILMVSIIYACYASVRAPGQAMEAFLGTSFGAWAAVGAFVAIVGGMAVFMDDLEPRLHSFWRSRPVNINQWFAVKFLTGLSLPLAILPLPAIAALAFTRFAGVALPDDSGEAIRMGTGFLVVQIGCFCAAVLMIVLVRQAAYAAILTIGAVGMFAVTLAYIAPRITAPQFQLVSLVASAAAVALAWIALRRDWGWTP